MIDIKYLIIGLIILLVIVFLYTNEHFGGTTSTESIKETISVNGDFSIGTPSPTKVLSYDEYKAQTLSKIQDKALRDIGLSINDLDILLKLGYFSNKYDIYGQKMRELLLVLGEPNNEKVTGLIQKIYGIPEPAAKNEALEILDKLLKYDINKIRSIIKAR